MILRLQRGFDYNHAAVASDGRVIAVLAGRQALAMTVETDEDLDDDDDDISEELPDDELQLSREREAVVLYSELTAENLPRDVGRVLPTTEPEPSPAESLPQLGVWLVGQQLE